VKNIFHSISLYNYNLFAALLLNPAVIFIHQESVDQISNRDLNFMSVIFHVVVGDEMDYSAMFHKYVVGHLPFISLVNITYLFASVQKYTV
jgi:hypothetical protein